MPGVLDALRVRDFRLLWAGRFVSLLGTWLLTVAVPAYVLELTGSLMATGLTLAAEYLPLLLLGPLAGVLSDRWDRRRVMLATDLFRAVVVAAMLVVDSPAPCGSSTPRLRPRAPGRSSSVPRRTRTPRWSSAPAPCSAAPTR